MDVKQAVQIAKKHIAEIFADEQISNIGLEEVEFNATKETWVITIGFSRSWDGAGNISLALGGHRKRTFKTVRIEDKSGEVQSIKHRDVAVDS